MQSSKDQPPSKEHPIVYGADFSVYVQAVRLTLAEKGIPHRLVPINPFENKGLDPEYLALHPFARVPAFDDGQIQLYESDAIARYIDDAYPGPLLIPPRPEDRARANQLLSILNSYAYPNWIGGLYEEEISKPDEGLAPDQATIAAALPLARTALIEIIRLRQETPGAYLAGETPSLPDFFCAPMYHLLMHTPTGKKLLVENPGLQNWWQLLQQRETIRELLVA
ncbi:glutathione S-transferase family protein [Kiloniella laminariae]|uniref:Glutathione S-transferase family protein n=1 Tax=Kiloniella laminariae TaxID=454162 RepID=A0ABT4LG20_9PROT|nr:glutathione S-transferase family protein [Kiloniella laminariae]MCZ4279885.1 glutathione S-transferase family protein [Kiloniella laminariae]